MHPKLTTSEEIDIETYEGQLKVKVQKIIDQCREEQQEDAFYVCDLGDVLRKHEKWMKLLPRVRPHYAVKCNDDTVVLEMMASIGMGFDCASKNEIKKVFDCTGVGPERIIFANPCKQRSHIKYACNNNVQVMTFDNLDELEKVKVLYPDAKLVLRILPTEYKATCNLGVKFGAPQSQVPALLARAQELNLNIIGVSFHVGSGCLDARAFPDAVQLARDTFDECLAYGFEPYLLDIGGGFPGDDLAAVSFEDIVKVLAPALDQHFPVGSGVYIIAEPGRYFVASAYNLAVNVIAKRKNDEPENCEITDEKPKFMYYVNDGVYGSFNCLLYDHAQVHPTVPDANDQDPEFTSSVWGPTCDGLDCISTKTYLPELDIGDWMLFNNMGAYTLSAGSTFNGIPRPKGNYVIGIDDLAALGQKCRILQKLMIQFVPLSLVEVMAADFSDVMIPIPLK